MAINQVFVAVFVAIVLLNGLCPFFGVKWEYSMSMFSNLNYETSNHFFMPSSNPFKGREFYYVKSLEIDDSAPASAVRLKDLLQRIGHLESVPAVAGESPRTTPPISRNMLCYHIAQLKKSGANFVIAFQEEDNFLDPNQTVLTEITHASCPPEWSRYDYFSRYPPIKGDYSTITTFIRERGE